MRIAGSMFLVIVLATPLLVDAQRGAPSAAVPDDAPAARDSATARLKAAPARAVCDDTSTMSRTHGSACASREFPAPPILEAPKFAWEAKPGWWGAWSPFLVGNLVLTGSCNNDGNEGLSALDTATGKIVWRIGSICAVGHRRGSMGAVAFYELPSGEVLLVYPRENGEPTDYYVIDVKAGRIVRSLSPARVAPMFEANGTFLIVTQSTPEQSSYLTALGPDLQRQLWRNDGFRLAMSNTDPRYTPTFSAPAVSGAIMYRTIRSKEQPEPPTRQLHAIDLQSGKTLWRHTNQPTVERTGTAAYRSDDGNPMVAGGRVIIKVSGLLGVVGIGRPANGEGLRALDPRTGATVWTTAAVPEQRIINRVAAGSVLVTEVTSARGRELWGYRLTDGGLAWRRPVANGVKLLAASGGAFYTSEQVGKEDQRMQGLDGETGTLIWTTVLPGHNLVFDTQWGIEDARSGTGLQGPAWRIGRDGAIYGVKLDGAYKLQ